MASPACNRSRVEQRADRLPDMDSANRFRQKRRNRENLHVGQSLLAWNRHRVGRDDFRDVWLEPSRAIALPVKRPCVQATAMRFTRRSRSLFNTSTIVPALAISSSRTMTFFPSTSPTRCRSPRDRHSGAFCSRRPSAARGCARSGTLPSRCRGPVRRRRCSSASDGESVGRAP